MVQSYKSDQIIQYLYEDLSIAEYLETEYAIETYPDWNESFKKLKSAFSALPRIQFFPSGRTVKSILKYSLETTV